MAIPHRVLRIWPAYILTMMFFYSVFMKTGSGPFWANNEKGSSVCSSMWKEVLFISNFVSDNEHACLGQGWYLQIDFQLFIVGLALLFLHKKKPTLAIIVTTVFAVGSLVFVFVLT